MIRKPSWGSTHHLGQFFPLLNWFDKDPASCHWPSQPYSQIMKIFSSYSCYPLSFYWSFGNSFLRRLASNDWSQASKWTQQLITFKFFFSKTENQHNIVLIIVILLHFLYFLIYLCPSELLLSNK